MFLYPVTIRRDPSLELKNLPPSPHYKHPQTVIPLPLPDSKMWFSTEKITKVSLLQSPVAACNHSSRCLTLSMVMLDLRATAWSLKPISQSSWHTVHPLMLIPEAVWNSRESDATDDDALRTSALIGLALWVCVVYYFVAKLLLLLGTSTSQ